VTPEEHRRLGIELYNGTWKLLGGGADPEETIDAAHASAHHWRHAAGTTAANPARGHWLCSHVYAVLGRAEPALHHAARCLELVQARPAEMEDFDLPSAYEALARAHAAAGDRAEAARYVELGRAETAKIEDAADRKHLESQFATIAT